MDCHPHPPLTGLTPPGPHTCCTEAPGKARWARRAFACCHKCGLASVHSFPLSCCLQPSGRGGMQDLLDRGFLLVAAAAPVPVSGGRAGHHQSVSVSASLMLRNLSTSSRSSATMQSKSSTWFLFIVLSLLKSLYCIVVIVCGLYGMVWYLWYGMGCIVYIVCFACVVLLCMVWYLLYLYGMLWYGTYCMCCKGQCNVSGGAVCVAL